VNETLHELDLPQGIRGRGNTAGVVSGTSSTENLLPPFPAHVEVQRVWQMLQCAHRRIVGLTEDNSNEIVAVFAWLRPLENGSTTPKIAKTKQFVIQARANSQIMASLRQVTAKEAMHRRGM
jgi:hypothetical protein